MIRAALATPRAALAAYADLLTWAAGETWQETGRAALALARLAVILGALVILAALPWGLASLVARAVMAILSPI